jgi:hypothetical protein
LAEITWRTAPYSFGTEQRERLTFVYGTGLRAGRPTARLVARAAPQPLSQYPLGATIPGYRLEHTERGHIIGLQFGGPEASTNLVPMYADFNGGSGAWGKLESRLVAWLEERRNRSIGMNVSIHYADAESPIPTSFGVTFVTENDPPPIGQFGGFQFHVHPPAHIARDDVDEADLLRLDALKRAQRIMMDRHWLIERTGHITIAGSGRSMRSGATDIPVAIGALDVSAFDLASEEQRRIVYLCRPYAVLDFLWFEEKEIYRQLGFAPVGRFDNTQPFGEAQKSAIRKVNILAHLGYMVSDLHGLSPEEPYHSLYIGSADASAQVDHIAGKAGAGSNCFSNARLVSKKMNLALNQAIVKDSVNAVYQSPMNWPALARRVEELWSGL